MIRNTRLFLFVMFGLGIIVATALPTPHPVAPTTRSFAQENDDEKCTMLVTDTLAAFEETCGDLEAGEACISAEGVLARVQTTDEEGNVTGVESITTNAEKFSATQVVSLSTTPPNTASGMMGVAQVAVKADLSPQTDGAVNIMVFGGAEVTPAMAATTDLQFCEAMNNRQEGINIRRGAGRNYPIVDALKPTGSLDFHGRNAGGDWILSNRGWLFAELVDYDCTLADVPVVDSTKAGYPTAMQVIQLRASEDENPCNNAPSGIIVQVPADSVANLLVNNTEVRLGSTALIIIEPNNVAMRIINIEGRIDVFALDVNQRLLVGNSTRVLLEEVEGELFPEEPPAIPTRLDPDDVAALQPVFNELPVAVVIPRPVVTTSRPTTQGWGPCGSCDSCGYPSQECVTSPEGVCLWDPSTCRGQGAPAGAGPATPFLSGTNHTCMSVTIINQIFTLNNPPSGATIASFGYTIGDTAVSFITTPAPSIIGPYQVRLVIYCSSLGTSVNSVTITDTLGNNYSGTGTVTVN